MTQPYGFFFAGQNSQRIAGGRVDHDQLDRVRANIDGRDFHAVFALSVSAMITSLEVSLSSVFGFSVASVLARCLPEPPADSSSMVRATARRSSAATLLTGREASI